MPILNKITFLTLAGVAKREHLVPVSAAPPKHHDQSMQARRRQHELSLLKNDVDALQQMFYKYRHERRLGPEAQQSLLRLFGKIREKIKEKEVALTGPSP